MICGAAFWSYIVIQTLNVVDTKQNLNNSGQKCSSCSKVAVYYHIKSLVEHLSVPERIKYTNHLLMHNICHLRKRVMVAIQRTVRRKRKKDMQNSSEGGHQQKINPEKAKSQKDVKLIAQTFVVGGQGYPSVWNQSPRSLF